MGAKMKSANEGKYEMSLAMVLKEICELVESRDVTTTLLQNRNPDDWNLLQSYVEVQMHRLETEDVGPALPSPSLFTSPSPPLSLSPS